MLKKRSPERRCPFSRQSSTMCSSSLSSCCTSWTWCSFQPCPVGNQPAFSLAVCVVCVCVRCCRAMLSQAFSSTNSLSYRASSVDWPQRLCLAGSDECYPDSLAECHQCNLLKHDRWTGLSRQEWGNFCTSCSTSSPSFSSFFLLPFCLFEGKQSKGQT